jgi:hypothetical protein
MTDKELKNKKQREYRMKVGLDKYREKRVLYQREWTKKNPNYAKEFRIKCLNYYSNNCPRCACCGEATYQFLGIDHINGGGNKHRQAVGTKKNGGTIYRWLVKNSFPDGYQVLCHNCNLAKGFYGICPHKIL